MYSAVMRIIHFISRAHLPRRRVTTDDDDDDDGTYRVIVRRGRSEKPACSNLYALFIIRFTHARAACVSLKNEREKKKKKKKIEKPPRFFRETAYLIDDGPPVHLTVRLVRSISRKGTSRIIIIIYTRTRISLHIHIPVRIKRVYNIYIYIRIIWYERVIFLRTAHRCVAAFYFCRLKLLMHARKGSAEWRRSTSTRRPLPRWAGARNGIFYYKNISRCRTGGRCRPAVAKFV